MNNRLSSWLRKRRSRKEYRRHERQRQSHSRTAKEDGKARRRNPRLIIFQFFIVLCLAFLAASLGTHQILKAPEYLQAEERQNYRRIVMPGPRGNIYDRDGRLLVGNRPVYKAVVSLNELRPEFRVEYFRLLNEARDRNQRIDRGLLNTTARANIVQAYLDQLNDLLGREEYVNSTRLERHFSQSLLLPFPLFNDLTPEEYARLIEQVAVESPIQVIAESARFYPYASAASHVLGFVSSSNEIPATEVPGADLLTFAFEGRVGRSGLESAFDDILQGQPGGEIWSVDPGGFQAERLEYRHPVKGHDIHTTLDIDIQLAAEKAIGDKMGAAIALHIHSGEILAIASRPGYDLNDLSPFLSHAVDQRIREEGGWLNRASQGLYPPGSTFKLITAIAGLRQGVIKEDTEVYCPGYYTVGGRRFRCHRHSGHGWEDLVEAIRDSCNVYFYDKGIEVGVQAIADEARRFGLSRPTGIEIPGETRSMLIPDPAWKRQRLFESWFGGDTANLSIGQGYLLVTPLQMATFVASLARNETLTHPTILLASEHRELVAEHRSQTRPEPIGLDPRHYEMVMEGMRQSGQTGTGRLAGTRQFPAAGKTGTAQVRKDGQPTTLAWFVGFAPAVNPEIAIAVLIEGVPEQETRYGGGSTAAPIARTIFETYLEKRQADLPALLAHP